MRREGSETAVGEGTAGAGAPARENGKFNAAGATDCHRATTTTTLHPCINSIDALEPTWPCPYLTRYGINSLPSTSTSIIRNAAATASTPPPIVPS